MRPKRILLFSALLMALASCGREDAPTPAGNVVMSPEPQLAEDFWTISEEPRLSIGEDGSVPGHALFEVKAGTMLSDGRIVIFDGGSNEARWFDPDGRFLSATGGTGGGPGEYRMVSAMWRVPGDSVVVGDFFLGRVSVLDSEGRFSRSFPVRPEAVEGYRIEGAFPDGTLLIRVFKFVAPPAQVGLAGVDSLVWIRLDPSTNEPTRITSTVMRIVNAHEWDGRLTKISTYFSPSDLRAAIRDYEVVALTPEAFGIEVWDTTGAHVASWRRAWEPVETSAADQREYVEWRIENAGPGVDVEGWRRVFAETPREEFFPPTARVAVDATGHTWVEAYKPLWAETSRWSVFDPEGRWLGDLTTAAFEEILEIGDDYIMVLEKDWRDVEIVRLYALDRRSDAS